MRENFIGQILGGYLLEDVINSGGMATVYKGLHMQTHRVVAVKVLPAYFAHDPQFLRRFRREAKAVSMLQHPHIVRVHAAGESDGLPYMIMEYVGGGTFSDLLANGRLTWEGAAVLISQVASALNSAGGEVSSLWSSGWSYWNQCQPLCCRHAAPCWQLGLPGRRW